MIIQKWFAFYVDTLSFFTVHIVHTYIGFTACHDSVDVSKSVWQVTAISGLFKDDLFG